MNIVYWIVGGILALGTTIMVVSLITSEEGYEDETGYHSGKPPIDKKDVDY